MNSPAVDMVGEIVEIGKIRQILKGIRSNAKMSKNGQTFSYECSDTLG